MKICSIYSSKCSSTFCAQFIEFQSNLKWNCPSFHKKCGQRHNHWKLCRKLKLDEGIIFFFTRSLARSLYLLLLTFSLVIWKSPVQVKYCSRRINRCLSNSYYNMKIIMNCLHLHECIIRFSYSITSIFGVCYCHFRHCRLTTLPYVRCVRCARRTMCNMSNVIHTNTSNKKKNNLILYFETQFIFFSELCSQLAFIHSSSLSIATVSRCWVLFCSVQLSLSVQIYFEILQMFVWFGIQYGVSSLFVVVVVIRRTHCVSLFVDHIFSTF